MRCKILADKIKLYSPEVIVSSPEPKAMETAQILCDKLGKTFEVIEGLREHDRSNVGWLDEERFEAKVSELFGRPDTLVFGNETAHQARGRFANAIATAIEKYPETSIAAVAHGTVITLLVAQHAGLSPFPLWKELDSPSFVVLPLPQMDRVIAIENHV